MNNACRRLPLEHAFETRGDNGDDGLFDDVSAVLLEALGVSPWPHFLSILRARGPELVTKLDQVFARPSGDDDTDGGRDRRPLEDRLAAVGVADDDLSYWSHAVRMKERADELCIALGEQPRRSRSAEERHHIDEAHRATWMFEFSRMALFLVAFDVAPATSAGFQNVLRLAVDSARDAYAHWSVALRTAEDATDAA